MSAEDGGHLWEAIAAVANRDYERAGDEYTRAAWRTLAEPRAGLSPFDPDEKGWVGEGLASLASAAIAYRVGGRSARTGRRSAEGIAVARDLETGLQHPAQRACLREFVADFRAIAGMDRVGGAYEAAIEAYETAADEIDDPQRWGTTPLFRAAAGPIKQVARGLSNGEIAVEWGDLHGDDPADPGRFLARRATYKRQRFPGLLERAEEMGHLAAPRGSTEYDNDVYRCPECGSNDVNWIAEATLCMRCSTPMTRQ